MLAMLAHMPTQPSLPDSQLTVTDGDSDSQASLPSGAESLVEFLGGVA